MIYNWKKIVKHSVPILTLFALIEIFGGQVLQGNEAHLVSFPIFLISIPVINAVGGNIGCILGARIASGLHVGYIEYKITDKQMRENVITALCMGILSYIILSILIYYIAVMGGIHTGIDSMMEFIIIFLTVGISLILIICFTSVLTAFLSFRKGLDPDDMVAPVVTTIGDTIGIVLLFVMIGVVGIW